MIVYYDNFGNKRHIDADVLVILSGGLVTEVLFKGSPDPLKVAIHDYDNEERSPGHDEPYEPEIFEG